MEQQSVEAWLKRIDLVQYSNLFYSAGVCKLDQCYNLNEQTLTQIGVTRMGHRKRILTHLPEEFYDQPPILPSKTVTVIIPKQDSLLKKNKPVPIPRKNVEKDNPVAKPVPLPRSLKKAKSSLESTSQFNSTNSSTHPVQSDIPINNFTAPSSCSNYENIVTSAESNSFCLPPPDLSAPPLPAGPFIEDLKEFDHFTSQLTPPVPPRSQLDNLSSLKSLSRTLENNSMTQKDSTSQSQALIPSSFPERCTPHKKIPFTDHSFDLSKNVHSLNTHPALKNIPFSDITVEYKNVNTEINKTPPLNADLHIYVNVDKMIHKSNEDFDPCVLKLENMSQRPADQSKEDIWLQEPPPACWSQEDSSSVYEVPNLALGDTSSSEGSISDDPLASESISSIDIRQTDTSTTSLGRSGYLSKQGGVNANMGWRRRWVVFSGSDIRYYANSKSHVSKRIVPVSWMVEAVNDVKDSNASQFKFRLITRNRTFLFASNSRDDSFLWCNRLTEAILGYKEPEGGMKPGGDMCNADKEGFIKFGGRRNPYFVVIKEGKLCYYDTEQDFKIASPVHEIELKLASVKSLSLNQLQLSTNYGFFHLTFEKPHDANQWKLAIEEGIADGIGDNAILDKVMENPSNQHCGDCSAPDPHWAAIDKGLVLCKQCAGIHRDFNANRVKSLRMDTKIWTPSLIEMMKRIGNKNANEFWCGNMPAADQISEATETNFRKQYIENKYLSKKFCCLHQFASDKKQMNELLVLTANTDNILLAMKLVFSGANMLYSQTGSQEGTALSIAKQASQHVQAEFFYQNGGDRLIDGLSGSHEAEINRRRYEVCKRGHLMKTGSNMKDFLKRYCVLEHATLSYYSAESSNIAKDSLDCETMLFLQCKPQDRFPHAFELSTSRNNNRIYLFAADSADKKLCWMQALSKVFCPVDIMEKVGISNFSLAGICFFKDGLMMEWQKSWLMLNDRKLNVFDKDMNLNTVDLRKATSVKYHDTHTCQHCIEKTGRLFIVDIPGRALYLQADLIRDTERLFRTIGDAVKRSGPTLEDQQLTAEDVPVIIYKCIEFVELYGIEEEGIYRKAGAESHIRSLLEKFRADARGISLKEGEVFVHDVANVLKRFLRELKEPIVTREQHSLWIQAAAKEDLRAKYCTYHSLLNRPGFPRVNYLTLKKLAMHLHMLSTHSVQNKMTMDNISMVFGSSLMGQNDMGTASLTQEMCIIQDIVMYRNKLFQVQEEEKKADKNMKIAEQKLKELVFLPQSQTSDSCLMGIHYLDFHGECEFTQKICSQTTVSDVVEAMKVRFKLQTGAWALHEIIKSGVMERPLHPKELVLKVIGEWKLWGEEYRTTACLCLKSNETIRKIQEAFTGRAPFAMMEYREKKEKKKTKMFAFEFKQAKLSVSKNKKSTSPTDLWNVENINIYIGADHDKPPTKWAFSFLTNGDRVGTPEIPSFGSSVWCLSQDERLVWLSAMFKAQHSDWLS